MTEAIGATFKLGKKSRLTADLALGQWKQNETPFIPWTTNTSIKTPSGENATTAALPATALDGKVDTLSFAAFFTTRLTDALGLHARYRRYDFDNKTPRYSLNDGYVRFDAVWEDIPRITVPYGYTNDYFDVYGTYNKGSFGFEAGFKRTGMARTFREAEDTTENVFRGVVDFRGNWIVLRAIGEVGNRDYSNYHAVEAEEHSFLPEPGAVALPANQTVLRRYDQANRDLVRWGARSSSRPRRASSPCSPPTSTPSSSTTRARWNARTSRSSPGSRSTARAASRSPWAWWTTSTTPSPWRRTGRRTRGRPSTRSTTTRTATSCRPAARAAPP